MAKLKKAEREFFSEFAKAGVGNLLGPALAYRGIEIPEEGMRRMLDTLDLDQLTQSIGEEFLKIVDFKTIKKVDAFMRSDEFRTVVEASTQVNAAVNDLVVSVVAGLIPAEELEAAE